MTWPSPRAPAQRIGQPVEALMREQMRAGSEALLETDAADGTPIFLGYSRAPLSGAAVTIAMPQALALQEMLRAVAMIALAVALVLLAGFSLAWAMGGRIGRSIRALTVPARALASGEPYTLEAMSFCEAEAVADGFRSLQADLQRHRQQLEMLVAERTGQLEKSRAQLEHLYATTPAGLSLVDTELRVMRINDYQAAIHGRSVTTHLGHPIGELIADPLLRHAILAGYRDVLRTGAAVEGRELSGISAAAPQQLSHWIASYHPLFDADGGLHAIAGLLLDISEQKRGEAALQQSKRLFKSVVENIPAMIFVKRADDLRFELFNRHGEQLLGLAPGATGQERRRLRAGRAGRRLQRGRPPRAGLGRDRRNRAGASHHGQRRAALPDHPQSGAARRARRGHPPAGHVARHHRAHPRRRGAAHHHGAAGAERALHPHHHRQPARHGGLLGRRPALPLRQPLLPRMAQQGRRGGARRDHARPARRRADGGQRRARRRRAGRPGAGFRGRAALAVRRTQLYLDQLHPRLRRAGAGARLLRAGVGRDGTQGNRAAPAPPQRGAGGGARQGRGGQPREKRLRRQYEP